MNGQLKTDKNRKAPKDKKGSWIWVRLICAICLIAFVFVSCIGCTSYVSTDELDALKNEFASELDLLKSSNEAAQLEIDTLKYNDEVAQQQIGLLKNRNEAAQQEINDLKNSNDAAKQEIDSLKNSNQTAQQEINALKNSNQAAQQKIDDLKNGNEALQQEIDALKNSNQAAQQKIDDLKNGNEALQQEIDALKNSNQAAQQEIDALKNGNEALQQEIEHLKKQIEDLQNNSSTDEPAKKIKIYIDQGHNPTSYHNTGATGNGLFEQDLTFTIGCLLAQLLEKDERFEICLSRPTENTVLGTDNASSLEARVRGAQEFGADYFISLHINSYELDSANGIEVFVAEQDSTSYTFGKSLLQGMVNSTNLRDRGMKLNPDLYVLKNATMPAALLEMGFISNSDDAALLSESPELFAQGIYDGILAYFDLPAQNISAN